jgi:hypothetical protein
VQIFLTGHEVDVIAEWGGDIHIGEIKSSATLNNDYIKNLRYFIEISKNFPGKLKSYLLYNGEQEGDYLGVKIIPKDKIYTMIS